MRFRTLSHAIQIQLRGDLYDIEKVQLVIGDKVTRIGYNIDKLCRESQEKTATETLMRQGENALDSLNRPPYRRLKTNPSSFIQRTGRTKP